MVTAEQIDEALAAAASLREDLAADRAAIARLTTERDEMARRVISLTLALTAIDAQAKAIESALGYIAGSGVGDERNIAAVGRYVLAIHDACRRALEGK